MFFFLFAAYLRDQRSCQLSFSAVSQIQNTDDGKYYCTDKVYDQIFHGINNTNIKDALWYCYAVISTAGFGDVVAVTFIGKMCSVLLTIYSLFVVAIATGVVVNFYTQMVEMQRKETLAMFMDQLERLPELSREELENISRKVRQFR